MRPQELGVGHSSDRAKSLDHVPVDFEQRASLGIVPRQCARRENATLMGHVERRRTVCVRIGEHNFALTNHTVDVKHATWNELLNKIMTLLVSHLIQPHPSLL